MAIWLVRWPRSLFLKGQCRRSPANAAVVLAAPRCLENTDKQYRSQFLMQLSPELWEFGTPDVQCNCCAPQGEAVLLDSCPSRWHSGRVGSMARVCLYFSFWLWCGQIHIHSGYKRFSTSSWMLQRVLIHALLWISVSTGEGSSGFPTMTCCCYSLLSSVSTNCVLKEMTHFIEVIKFVGLGFFIIFLYYPFNVHGIDAMAPLLTWTIAILSSLFWGYWRWVYLF